MLSTDRSTGGAEFPPDDHTIRARFIGGPWRERTNELPRLALSAGWRVLTPPPPHPWWLPAGDQPEPIEAIVHRYVCIGAEYLWGSETPYRYVFMHAGPRP